MTDELARPEDPGPHPPRGDAPGTLETRVVHDGRIVHLSVDTVRFPDGSEGELEVVRHPGAAAVVPFMGRPGADDAEILLLRQYRYASGGYLYEVPAGLPSGADEPWEECAARELEEETGWRAGGLREITAIYTTPGFTNEVIRLFVAWELTEGDDDLDEDEFLDVVRVPFSTALEWVRDGRVTDGKSVAALLYAALFVRGGEPR